MEANMLICFTAVSGLSQAIFPQGCRKRNAYRPASLTFSAAKNSPSAIYIDHLAHHILNYSRIFGFTTTSQQHLMKVVLSYARRLGASRRKRRARRRSAALVVPEKVEWHHTEHVDHKESTIQDSKDPIDQPKLDLDIKELLQPNTDVKDAVELRADPPLYTECVGEKEEAYSEKAAVQVTAVEVAKAAEGRPRELLYRSQFNELQEKRRPEVRLRKVTRVVPDCTDYRAVYHKQAVAEVWIELFRIIKVGVWAILAWLFVYGMIPSLK